MTQRPIDDETRRELLRFLGVAGAISGGSSTLAQVSAAMTPPDDSEALASAGRTIRQDIGDSLDAETLRTHADSFASAASALGDIGDRGVPETQREDFAPVASAGRPIVEYLESEGFYATTNDDLPEFSTDYIDDSVARFASEEALAAPLADLGFADGSGVDMLATVVDKSAEIADQHWIGNDRVDREMISPGDVVPDPTLGCHEGSLLWLQDIDEYLWQNAVLVTEDVYADAVWYARAMTAGFHLVTSGAIAAAEDDGTYDDEQLAALLSVGFAGQTICDPGILQEVYWLRDDERASRRTDLSRAEVSWR
jgi:hypothetical protein